MKSTPRWLTALLAALAIHGLGCAMHTIQTTRQLDAGDVVSSMYVDVPGASLLPRVGGQLTRGLGGVMDLHMSAGLNGPLLQTGAGARAYLGTRWIASLQLINQTPLLGGEVGGGEYGENPLGLALPSWRENLAALTARVHMASTPDVPLYIGLHTSAIVLARRDGRDVDATWYASNVGVMMGMERAFSATNRTRYHIELLLAPLTFERGGSRVFGFFTEDRELGDVSAPTVQLNVGLHWPLAPSRRPTPSPTNSPATPSP